MPRRDDSDLRLHDLRTLSVVLRERNLTRAAELLDSTQPAISKILARLRAHFGDPLVIRDGHGMQLTPKAIEMTQPLRSLLDASQLPALRASLAAHYEKETNSHAVAQNAKAA